MKKYCLLALCMILNFTGYAYDFEFEGMYFNIISAYDRTVFLTYKDENYNSYSGDVVIPRSVVYKNMEFTVENVDYNTFYKCSDLKSITLPKGLKNFGTVTTGMSVGFSYTSIWDLYVPDLETYINLNVVQGAWPFCPDGSLFVDGELLVDAIIPDGIEKIRFDCFSNCKSLKTVTMSSTVQTIENGAFSDCINLEKVQLNDEITKIGIHAFFGCSNLKEINLPKNLKTLGDGYGNGGIFDYCYSLEGPIIIPEGLESLPTGIFYGCKSLKEVVLPSTLKKIFFYAFYGCDSLKSITCNALNPPLCQEIEEGTYTIFEGIDIFNCVIKVPDGTKYSYSQADGWKQFFNIVEENEANEENEADIPASKCAEPTISYSNGKLIFHCDTEESECVATITDTDIKTHYGNEITLTSTYYIRYYATAKGYENSDTCTALLCWINADLQNEVIENGITQMKANAALIQSSNGLLSITGISDGTDIIVYSSSGFIIDTAKAQGTTICIDTGLSNGEIAILRIGDNTMKIAIE